MGFVRLLFAIAVILAHTGPLPVIERMTNGPLAVQGFFILSGFIMTLLLHERYTDKWEFYFHRVSRIATGYVLALILFVIVARLAGVNHFTAILRADWDFLSKALMMVANVFIVGSDVMMFTYPSPDGLAFTPDFQIPAEKFYHYHYVAAVWSLPVELAFYALAPFVVKSLRRLLVLALVSVLVRLATYAAFGAIDPWTYRFLPSEMVMFVIGAACYHLTVRLRAFHLPTVCGYVAVAVATFSVIFYAPVFNGALLPFFAIFSMCLTVAIATERQLSPKFMLWDRGAAEITYMVYLTHMLFVNFLKPFTGEQPSSIVVIVLTLLLSIPMTKVNRWVDLSVRSIPGRLRMRKISAEATNG
jgi:peptidoglycan/LPS O-acetylase OafA/YrhL